MPTSCRSWEPRPGTHGHRGRAREALLSRRAGPAMEQTGVTANGRATGPPHSSSQSPECGAGAAGMGSIRGVETRPRAVAPRLPRPITQAPRTSTPLAGLPPCALLGPGLGALWGGSSRGSPEKVAEGRPALWSWGCGYLSWGLAGRHARGRRASAGGVPCGPPVGTIGDPGLLGGCVLSVDQLPRRHARDCQRTVLASLRAEDLAHPTTF